MKPSARWHDVYEIEPQRASIPAHSYVYATVTFSPPSMQTYNATLEAAVDGMPSAMSKYRNLTFDIQGEGNLPRINVARPTARNKKGAPVLLFRRLLLGRTQVWKGRDTACDNTNHCVTNGFNSNIKWFSVEDRSNSNSALSKCLIL